MLLFTGYTNFLVRGILPECEANQMLQFIHITQPIKPDLLTPPDEGKGMQNSRILVIKVIYFIW